MNKLKLIDINIATNQKIIIDSQTKQILSDINGNKSNAYNSVDHSKYTFVIAKPGNTVVNVPPGSTFNIEYKEWVMD